MDLNNVEGDDDFADFDEPALDYLDSSHQLNTRIDNLCDILSSFDETRTPSEYKRDIVDNERPLMSFDDILVQGSISGTIYRLAIHDETLYRRLRQVVPGNVCARQYYNKQRQRALLALRSLDHYARTGPQTRRERDDTVCTFPNVYFLFQTSSRVVRCIAGTFCSQSPSELSCFSGFCLEKQKC